MSFDILFDLFLVHRVSSITAQLRGVIWCN